jgi:branched-chain amino acid transport system substrate-binding protein
MTSSKGAISKTQALVIIAIVVVAGAVGVGYYIVSQPAPAKNSVVVGWVHSLTGALAGQTATFDVYYKWIIQDYNAHGGLYVPEYGRKLNITYIEYDDESDITKMLSLTEKLITVDKVDLLFAPVSTAFNFAAFPLYQKYHMPVVALTFGSDIAAEEMRNANATYGFNYCFSVLGMPSESATQVLQLFQYINTTKAPNQLNKVGIIYHADQHGVEYSLAIHDALVSHGFSVPVYQSYLPTITDFTPYINTLSAASVDAVIQCGYEGAFFIKSAQALAYNPELYMCGPSMETGLLVYNPYVYNLTKPQVNGTMLYDGWPSTAYKTGNLSAWATAHYTRTAATGFGWYPFPASATFYAGLQCLLEAVQKVGLNHTAIMLSLQNDNFTTIVGNTHLHRGYSMQCQLTGTICQWQGGDMCEVIWPLSAASATIMFPKPNWP